MYRGEISEDFPWALSGPVEHLRADGGLVFIRYIAAGGRPAAAVAEPTHEPRIDRATLVLPNNKSNILYTKTTEEAYFVAAFINAGPAQDALARFSVSTGITPAALARLPLPGYDAQDAEHRPLAELGQQATAARAERDDERLASLEREIDDQVWKVQAP